MNSTNPMSPTDNLTAENNSPDSPLHYYQYFSRLGVYPDPEAHQAAYDLLVTFRSQRSYGEHLKGRRYNVVTAEFFRWQRWAATLFGEWTVEENQKMVAKGLVDEGTRREYEAGGLEGRERLKRILNELWAEMHLLLYEQPQPKPQGCEEVTTP